MSSKSLGARPGPPIVKGRSREFIPKGLSPGRATGNGSDATPGRNLTPLPNVDRPLENPGLNGVPTDWPAVVSRPRNTPKIYIVKYPDAQDIVNHKKEPLVSFNITPIRRFWPNQHAIFLDIPDSGSFLIQPQDEPQPTVVQTVPLGALWKNIDEREIKPQYINDVERVTRNTFKPRLLSTYDWALLVMHLCDLAGYLQPMRRNRS